MTTTTDDLIHSVHHWKQYKVVVAGDFMLDRYVYGNAERLSPDAPVPVLAAQYHEEQPGGASNVCLDLLALRCKVTCLGVVGADDSGTYLRQALASAGCDTAGLLVATERRTTVKHNFVGLAQHRHPQKMFRVDDECDEAVSKKMVSRLIARARRLLSDAAVLCLEDYDKGLLTGAFCKQLIALARKMRVPVLVDPACVSDFRKYRGATCITPNRTEASQATGTSVSDTEDPTTLTKIASRLLSDLRLETVVITLDKQGLLLRQKQRRPRHVPTKARSVYDVTGAGDMVLAMLAGARANGIEWNVAAELANLAAGLEVEQFGPVPIQLDQILLTLLEMRHEGTGKRRELDQLLPELAAHRNQGKRVVFTNGCFDILHAGHVALLREARSCADLLVVGLNSDASIRHIKGADRPVNRLDDRIMVLSELQSVNYIVVFEQNTPMQLIRAIRPQVLVKGADYRVSEVVGADLIASYGGTVRLIDLVSGYSTTNIIRKITAKNPHQSHPLG